MGCSTSENHLVGAREERGRHLQAESLGGLEIARQPASTAAYLQRRTCQIQLKQTE